MDNHATLKREEPFASAICRAATRSSRRLSICATPSSTLIFDRSCVHEQKESQPVSCAALSDNKLTITPNSSRACISLSRCSATFATSALAITKRLSRWRSFCLTTNASIGFSFLPQQESSYNQDGRSRTSHLRTEVGRSGWKLNAEPTAFPVVLALVARQQQRISNYTRGWQGVRNHPCCLL